MPTDPLPTSGPDSPATAVAVLPGDPGVLHLRLAGGARRNVLGRATLDALDRALAEPPDGTRVVLLDAEPPDFCAGYDLLEAERQGSEGLIAHPENFRGLRASRVPVVAALGGRVIGGGLELALLADVRLAAPGTTLAIPASALGLVYSEAGIRLLVDQVGESTARAMLLAGRVLTAEEALAAGIVTAIVPAAELAARARALARTIAGWPAVATGGNRRLIDAVTGRSREDTGALRRRSFDPRGELAASIARFARRSAARRQRPSRSA